MKDKEAKLVRAVGNHLAARLERQKRIQELEAEVRRLKRQLIEVAIRAHDALTAILKRDSQTALRLQMLAEILDEYFAEVQGEVDRDTPTEALKPPQGKEGGT